MTSLYVHIPFCKSKCSYCSFASFEKKDSFIAAYLKALKKEISAYKGSTVNTIYLGGGTPSYLGVAQLWFLFSAIYSNFFILPNTEITIEANPATFNLEKARAFKDLGANRVSLGVQSLNDEHLRWLGRPHTKLDALSSFKILREVGFDNISVDLMYSLPQQNIREIKEDVRQLLSLNSEHVSLYTLSISPGSELHKKKIKLANEDNQARGYRCVTELLQGSGFKHYEVSNFAREGRECRHNLNYWRGGNYIGLGLGAHSHRDGHRFWNTSDLDSYIRMIERRGSAKEGEENLRVMERLMESFLVSLRLQEGVQLQELESRFSKKLPKEKHKTINDLFEHALLVKEGERIKASLSGMMVLDEICSRLI